MYISEIKIKNFKKFNNNQFQFDHGINIVKGVNEQGKSTLLKAITASIFIDPSSNKYKEEFKSWNNSQYPVLELDFFIDTQLFALFKDFNTKETILKDVLKKEEEKNLAVINQKIKEFIGIANESVFRMSACINHDEITLIESGKKSLHEAIQDISLNEGGADVLVLLKDLSQKF